MDRSISGVEAGAGESLASVIPGQYLSSGCLPLPPGGWQTGAPFTFGFSPPLQCQPSPADSISKAMLRFLPVTLREKGNPWQQLWAETERSSPGAHNLLFLLLSYFITFRHRQRPRCLILWETFSTAFLIGLEAPFLTKNRVTDLLSISFQKLVGQKQLHSAHTRHLSQTRRVPAAAGPTRPPELARPCQPRCHW